MDDERASDEERQYIEEVELFARAGIKVCVFNKMEPERCHGKIETIGYNATKDAEGNVIKYGLRMNVCVGHSSFSKEKDWRIFTDE